MMGRDAWAHGSNWTTEYRYMVPIQMAPNPLSGGQDSEFTTSSGHTNTNI